MTEIVGVEVIVAEYSSWLFNFLPAHGLIFHLSGVSWKQQVLSNRFGLNKTLTDLLTSA